MKTYDLYHAYLAKTKIFDIVQEKEMDQVMNNQRHVYTLTLNIQEI